MSSDSVRGNRQNPYRPSCVRSAVGRLCSLSLGAAFVLGCDTFIDYRYVIYPSTLPSEACIDQALGIEPMKIQGVVVPDKPELKGYELVLGTEPQIILTRETVRLRPTADDELGALVGFQERERAIAAQCKFSLKKPSDYTCRGCGR